MAWEMFTWPAAPDDSIRSAVFTVSPQTSYWNFRLPTMPATTGPVCTPMRMFRWTPPRLARSYARFAQAGVYGATITRPDLFEAYLTELTVLRDRLKAGLSGAAPETGTEPVTVAAAQPGPGGILPRLG